MMTFAKHHRRVLRKASRLRGRGVSVHDERVRALLVGARRLKERQLRREDATCLGCWGS